MPLVLVLDWCWVHLGNEAKRGLRDGQGHRILDAWGLSQEPWQLLPWPFRNPGNLATEICVSPRETNRASPRPHLIPALPLLGQGPNKKKWRRTVLRWKVLSHFLWLSIYFSSCFAFKWYIRTCPGFSSPPLFLPDGSPSLRSQPECHLLREARGAAECGARVWILTQHFLAVWPWVSHLTPPCLSLYTNMLSRNVLWHTWHFSKHLIRVAEYV